jgi:hypothetical protein
MLRDEASAAALTDFRGRSRPAPRSRSQRSRAI